jgi:thioredoxin-related protein
MLGLHTHHDDGADHSSDSYVAAVFSKSYCPYCKSAKTLLSEKGAKAYIIELDQVGTFSKQEKDPHPP